MGTKNARLLKAKLTDIRRRITKGPVGHGP
jgi:hypothetical protein